MDIQQIYEILRLEPNNSDAYNNLGALFYKQGRIKEAIPQFEKCLRINPTHYQAHYNLANSFIKADMVLQAIDNYKSVLKLKPDHYNAKVNLAMAYVSLHDYAAALPYLIEAATKENDNAELQGHLAEAYLDLGKSQEALEQYQKALVLDPSRAEWHHNLAVLYLRAKQSEAAKTHFALSLDLQPNNPTAQHMSAALQQVDSTSNAPAEYVSDLFDQYSSYYNQHMLQDLKYRVPALLRQAVGKHLDIYAPQQNILDLGCGTGLCGPYFRDIARLLVGVDLSAGMLSQAKALGAYDALCRANILEAIPGFGQNFFDIIIAADVLVYIGDLKSVFRQVKQSLKPGGLFAFSFERTTEAAAYLLQTSGRFAHSEKYFAQLCAENDMQLLERQDVVLRQQTGEDIVGCVYIVKEKLACLYA